MIKGGVIAFVRADHIGSPAFATNSAGVKVWSATYLPFGGVQTSNGTLPPNRFPGQWFQSESGLHQNWMRDYDPTTGRYLQADPLGLVDGASVYGYVRQNPGRYTDPRGENPVAVCAVPGIGPICGKIVQTCIEGIVIGGIIVYAWIMEPDEVLEETCKECANTNDLPLPPNCPVEFARLTMLREVLMDAISQGMDVTPSGAASYRKQAEAYNQKCVPQGYPRLSTTLMR